MDETNIVQLFRERYIFFKSDGIQYDNKYDIHVGCNNAVSKVFIHKYELHNRVGQLVSFLLND